MEQPKEPNGRQHIQWLSAEMEQWKKEGILTEDQFSVLLKRYGMAEESKSRGDIKSARFISVISILGSILLGLGVILFFASNWKVMPVSLRLAIIFGLTASVYSAGFWLLYEKQKYKGVGKALIFLGVLFFGAGIWLIAQIYNINAHYPDGVLFWALGGVLTGMVTRLKPVTALSVFLLTLWTMMEQAEFQSPNYLYLLIFFVFIIPVVYYGRDVLSLVLSTLSFTVWFCFYNIIWQVDAAKSPSFPIMAAGVHMLFLGLFVFAKIQKAVFKRPEFEMPLRIISTCGIMISIYVFTFRQAEESLRKYLLVSIPEPGFFVTFILLIAAIGLSVYTLIKRGTKGRIMKYENLCLAFLAAMAVLYVTLPGMVQMKLYPFTITYNLLFFALTIGLMAVGFVEKRPIWVNLSLLFFVLLVVTRYFDYLWRLLPRSVFFIAGGLILIAGGVLLENKRRKLLREMGDGYES